MMDALEVILARHSYRGRYLPDAVPQKDLRADKAHHRLSG